MSFTKRIVDSTIKTLIRVCCRVHDEALAQVPDTGPLLVVSNHINFLEAPLLYTHLMPRKATGFAKTELWENPFSRFLFELWDGIPVRRGEADLNAMRLTLDFLRRGYLIAVAPEGTRSHDGKLQRGHPGIVLMALRSGAPILPLAHHGGEKLSANLRRLRRTDFYIHVGEPFYLDAGGRKARREVRQEMVDEIMYRIAALLPPDYRGYYADLDRATTKYLRFSE